MRFILVRDSYFVKGIFMLRLKDWEELDILMWIWGWCWENMNFRRGSSICKDFEVEKILLSLRKLKLVNVVGVWWVSGRVVWDKGKSIRGLEYIGFLRL